MLQCAQRVQAITENSNLSKDTIAVQRTNDTFDVNVVIIDYN
jgi:hypothetical protein